MGQVLIWIGILFIIAGTYLMSADRGACAGQGGSAFVRGEGSTAIGGKGGDIVDPRNGRTDD